jgi:hypothetical protein
MRKQLKTTATQFPLFPPIRRAHSLPGEIRPKIVPLLARLLHQHVQHESTPGSRQEVKNERED